MAKTVTPNYYGEAEAMLVRAEVIKNQLAEDLAEFEAKFPFMNADYVTALTTSIENANTLPLDNQVVSNIKLLTADVNAHVVLGRNALSDLNTYAKLAYKKDPAKQQAFGQKDWDKAYSDQEKMENALEFANDIAKDEPFVTDLSAKGFTVADNANLLTIATNIHSRNILQENAINKRPVTTAERITLYNSLWEIIKDISLAAKMLYRNDDAKRRSYLLYPNNTDTTTVNVRVNNTGTTDPQVNSSVKIVDSELVAQTTDENGVASFSSVNIDEFISLEITSQGGTITIIPDLSVPPGTTNDFTVEADE